MGRVRRGVGHIRARRRARLGHTAHQRVQKKSARGGTVGVVIGN